MLLSMFDVEGFILVGGQSSRMGRDKSELLFGAQLGVEHIANALRALTPTVRLVGNRGGLHSDFGNIPDSIEGWGALGGIHAALGACNAEWAAIAACDLPLVTPGLFGRLWQYALRDGDGFDAIVPIQPDERPQPLCAIYRRQSCLAAAMTLISQHEHKPRTLLASVRTRWVSFAEISDLPGAQNFFLNVNTPDDYEQATHILARLETDE
jgi:molybdopterin-guanine dinucleotide biosynthesis protein A